MRATVRARKALLLCVLIGVLTTSCTVPTLDDGRPTSAAEGAPAGGDGILRVGTLFPLSGPVSFIGPAQAAGVALAVADLNAAGGVNGAPVQILAKDSGDAASGTVESSFAELIAGGADAVIGPSSTVLSQRVIPLAVRANVPVVSPAASFPLPSELTGTGYFFRTVAPYGLQGFALGAALSRGGPTTVAFVYIDDELGRSLASTMAKAFQGTGATLVLSRAVTSPDLAPVMAEIVAAAPDVVVLASNYSSFESTTSLIAATVSAGFSGSKLWLTTQNTGDYSQAFPAGTLTGVRGIIDGVEPDADFIERLKTVDPGLSTFRYSAEAYDATILIALAAAVAHDDSGASIASRLADVSRGGIKCTSAIECLQALTTQSDIDYDGLSGPVNFSPDGDVSPAHYGLYEYDGGNIFVLKSDVVAG